MSDSRVVPTPSAPPPGGASSQPGVGAPAPGSSPAQAAPAAAAAPEISPKIQALMRREAMAVKREQEAKTYEAKVKAQEDALKAREAQVQAFDQLWKENPLKALEQRGIDPVQLAMARAGGGDLTPDVRLTMLTQQVQELAKTIAQEREAAQQQKNSQVETDSAEEERQWKADVGKFVESSSDKFPLLSAYKRTDLVLGAIDEHFERTLKETGVGEELSVEKASELTEALLMAEVKRGQELLSKREAVQAEKTATPRPQASRPTVPGEERWVEKPIKTLAGVQSTVASQPAKFLSDEERIARAVARVQQIVAAKG